MQRVKEGEVLASWLLAPRTGRCRVLVCVLTQVVCASLKLRHSCRGVSQPTPSTHLRGWRGEASPSVFCLLGFRRELPPACLERQVWCVEVPEGGLPASCFPLALQGGLPQVLRESVSFCPFRK